MNWPLGRRTTFVACRRALRVAGWPTLLAAVGCLLAARWWAPVRDAEATAPGAASPWLALPLVLAAMVPALAIAVFWPPFAQRRPGADWIAQLLRRRAPGVPAAIAGALLAQLVLTLPSTTVLARLLGAPATAHVHHTPAPLGEPLLDASRPTLRWQLPAGEPFREVQLRPLAGLPADAVLGAQLAAYGDGELLGMAPVRIVETRQFVRLAFAPRPLRELRLEYRDGTVPLALPPGAVVVVGASARSWLVNGLLLAIIALAPSFVACAIAALAGRVAALPTVLTVLASLLFLGTIGGVGPFGPAVVALMRGQWLASDQLAGLTTPWLVVGAAALLLAAFPRPRRFPVGGGRGHDAGMQQTGSRR
jgi:hypothetical protein